MNILFQSLNYRLSRLLNYADKTPRLTNQNKHRSRRVREEEVRFSLSGAVAIARISATRYRSESLLRRQQDVGNKTRHIKYVRSVRYTRWKNARNANVANVEFV